MNERDRQHFEDICEFSERALRITNELTYDAFVAQEAVLYSVRYCVVVIGESANALFPKLKRSFPPFLGLK